MAAADRAGAGRRGARALAALGVAMAIPLLSGCGFDDDRAGRETYARAQAELVGRSSAEIDACAPAPIARTPVPGGERRTYVAVEEFRSPYGVGATSRCTLDVDFIGGRLTRLTHDSANPGGFTDGSSTCGFIVDRCVHGRTTLRSLGQLAFTREPGESDADVDARGRAGASEHMARNAATFGAMSGALDASRARPVTGGGMASPAPMARPAPALSSGPMPTIPGFTPPPGSTVTRSGTMPAPAPIAAPGGDRNRPELDAVRCISVERNTWFRNSCAFPVSVTYCVTWPGNAMTCGGPSFSKGSLTVRANDRQLSAIGVGQLRGEAGAGGGRILFMACRGATTLSILTERGGFCR